jgi:hypothetical protein
VSELLVLGHDDVKRLLPMDERVELMEGVLADLALRLGLANRCGSSSGLRRSRA